MNKTIFKYIFNMQFRTVTFVSIFIFCFIFLFDFAEVTRKYPISNIQESLFAIKLSLLRTPSTFGEVFNYTYFVTATFSLWNLCKSHQITILKSMGKSPQQTLYPFFSFAIFISMIWLFIIHPAGLSFEKQYNKLTTPLNGNSGQNIWITSHKNEQIIFIKSICDSQIEGLSIFTPKKETKIFAQFASIEKDSWILKNTAIVDRNQIRHIDSMKIPQSVSSDLIELLLESPKKLDIHHLYKIYKIQKKDQVSLKLYELEFHKLLSYCFSFVLFSLIAALICFPINRYKTKTNIAIKVIFTAIVLRFIDNIFESLAHSGLLGVEFAVWFALALLTCISIAILIWREV